METEKYKEGGRQERDKGGDEERERTKQKENPLRSPMLAVVFEFV